MKEYNIQIKDIKLTIRQNDDGQFEVPNFIKELQKVGTALKPSYEPIIVARKPCEGTCVDNVLKWGVGGINIDECRIEHNEEVKTTNRQPKNGSVFNTDTSGYDNTANHIASASPDGRFPANTILTYDDSDYDEVCGGFPQSKGASSQNNYSNGHIYRGQSLQESTTSLNGYREWYNDEGSASRYFYCAKASKRDRDEGLDGFEEKYKLKDNVPDEIVEKIKGAIYD